MDVKVPRISRFVLRQGTTSMPAIVVCNALSGPAGLKRVLTNNSRRAGSVKNDKSNYWFGPGRSADIVPKTEPEPTNSSRPLCGRGLLVGSGSFWRQYRHSPPARSNNSIYWFFGTGPSRIYWSKPVCGPRGRSNNAHSGKVPQLRKGADLLVRVFVFFVPALPGLFAKTHLWSAGTVNPLFC